MDISSIILWAVTGIVCRYNRSHGHIFELPSHESILEKQFRTIGSVSSYSPIDMSDTVGNSMDSITVTPLLFSILGFRVRESAQNETYSV